jgi:hypothetical protein
MTKLQDFWIRLKTRVRQTPWLTLQLFLTALVVFIFLGLIIWSGSISRLMAPEAYSPTPTASMSTTAVSTETGVPLEYRLNAQQPNINVLGAGLMVLIVFVGTLTHLAYRKKKM